MIKDQISSIIEKCNELYGESKEKVEDFSFTIVFKYDFLENDIFILHHSNSNSESRIGWLFPLESITSREHSFFDSKHYGGFARIVSLYLKKNIDNVSSVMKNDEYIENSHILVIYNEYARKNKIDSIEELLLPLSKYGYYTRYSNDRKLYLNDYGIAELSKIKENKLVINKNKNISIDYINKIYTEILPFEPSPYYRFMLLYQIIENEMENLFYSKIEEYKNTNFSIGSIRIEITKLSKEDQLITMLFNEVYKKGPNPESIMSDIRDLFLNFKRQDEIARLISFSDVLYAFRNILVHSYYKCKNIDDKIKRIVDFFEIEIIDTIKVKKNV